MSARNAGPAWPRPASPIKTSPFWEIRQEDTCFNLIRLARNRENFDIVYLDCSHSIYVDLAPAVAAIR